MRNGLYKPTVLFEDTQCPYYVCKLKEELYKLKQAPRDWFLKLSECLVQWEFHYTNFDTYMMIYNKDGHMIIFFIYVDEILIIGNNVGVIQDLIVYLN